MSLALLKSFFRAAAVLAVVAALPACRRPASNAASSVPPSATPQAPAVPPGNGNPPPGTPVALPEFLPDPVSTHEGTAYWYDVPENSLAQRRAAPGEMTAASDTLPLHGYVRVTRHENGKSVIVRITDTGLHKAGAMVDLDREAAEMLGMIKAGETKVTAEVLALKNAEPATPTP